MTAEVAVMNRFGLALAADSAVTLGDSSGKIYTSADKLFQLHEEHPVAVMIYGGAAFTGLPWETVIKMFRAGASHEPLGAVSDYVDAFLAFLQTTAKRIGRSDQEDFVRIHAHIYLDFLESELERDLREQFGEDGPVSDAQLKRALVAFVRDEEKVTKEFQRLPGVTAAWAKRFQQRWDGFLRKVISDRLDDYPRTDRTEGRIAAVIAEILLRDRPGPPDSGLVIAGFGSDELFPSMTSLSVRGVVDGVVLYEVEEHVRIGGDELDAYVVPFAQKEMVQTFMNGVDPELFSLVSSSTLSLLELLSNRIVEEVEASDKRIAKQLRKGVCAKVQAVGARTVERWKELGSENYAMPVMQIVASLPKDELGAMAEALVNLTKFKRRVSRQQETVGGPIDVAVVTKGDGFVWLRRKHYFRPELNLRYVGRNLYKRA